MINYNITRANRQSLPKKKGFWDNLSDWSFTFDIKILQIWNIFGIIYEDIGNFTVFKMIRNVFDSIQNGNFHQ